MLGCWDDTQQAARLLLGGHQSSNRKFNTGTSGIVVPGACSIEILSSWQLVQPDRVRRAFVRRQRIVTLYLHRSVHR